MEGGPAAPALVDPGVAAVELAANRATRDRPMPTPRWWAMVGAGPGPPARRKASKMVPASSAGTPGPASSTISSRSAPLASALTHTLVPGGVCRVVLSRRFSTIRSTLGPSMNAWMGSASMSIGQPASWSTSVTTRWTSSRTSVSDRLGSSTPSSSRFRSSRSLSSRSSFLVFSTSIPTRSRACSRGRLSRVRSRVTATPSMAVSGVRRSWETARRKVSFRSSMARSLSAAASSRRRPSLSSCSRSDSCTTVARRRALSWRFSIRATIWREMTSSPITVPVKTRNGSNSPVVIWMPTPVTAATIRGA